MKNRGFATVVAAGALSAALALAGCSSGGSKADAGDASDQAATPATQQQDQKDQKSQKAAKYDVSIDDCAMAEDYQGNSAIIVTYTWTNNSDDATSFMVAVSDKAFQNGVQLDTATIMDADAYEAGTSLKEIKAGATQTVQKAYALEDTSDVTVECTELISFSDDILAEKTFSVA